MKGGKREGAGRKPKSAAGKGVVVGGRVAPDVAEAFNRTSEERGISKSELLEESLRAHLNVPLPSDEIQQP